VEKSYEVITSYSNKIIHTKCSSMTKAILSQFTKIGYRFNLQDLIENDLKSILHTCSSDSFYRYHTKALKIGVSTGILSKKMDYDKTDNPLMDLKSIQYWQSQLRSSKYRNIKENSVAKKTTKYHYFTMLNKFNQWLTDKNFKIKKTIQISKDTFQHVEKETVFSSVEEMLNLLENSPLNKQDVIKIIREYLNDSIHDGSSTSYMNSKFAAIMSYFSKNDQPLGMKYDSKQKYDIQEIRQMTELTLDEFMSMLTVGRPSIMEKAIFMCKFQGGYDSSTLADRFNFDGFRQIAEYFGSENHNTWDLGKCPIPIIQVRIKTGYQYTALLHRDAISCIQKYLDYKIKRHGSHDVNSPLFLNHYGNPITSNWISNRFFTLAERAGIQTNISKNQYKIEAHEVRDLLKSTLIDSGCRMDIADHVIGHKPKDSYEKQAKLYPETLRKEYSKASKRLNIFTKFTSVINGTDDSDELKIQLKEKLSELDRIKESRLSDEARQLRNDQVALEQTRQMRLLQDTVNELKKEIRTGYQLKKPIEFCCVNCSTVHDSQVCPACNSKLRRIFEQSVQG